MACAKLLVSGSHLAEWFALLGLVQCLASPCVFRLMEYGRVVVVTLVVHGDDVVCLEGMKERCNRFGVDLNVMVPVKKL